MNADQAVASEWEAFLENLAAELADAAYPVFLRHRVGDKWLDLELDLWKAMTASVRKLPREKLQAASIPCKVPKPSEFFG